MKFKQDEHILSSWDRLCRICLIDPPLSSPVNKLDEIDQQYNMSFHDMLNTCTNLKVSSDDNFPQLICSLCITHMHHALEFNKKSQSSNDILTQLFHKKNDLNYVMKCEVDEINEVDTDYPDADDYENKDIVDNVFVTDIDEKNILKDQLNPILPEKDEITDSKINRLVKIHTCSLCNVSCGYKELVAHKKTHPNTCWKCNINFNSVEEYNDHLKEHEENVCSECGKVFNNKGLCNAHKALAHYVKNGPPSVSIEKKNVHICGICHVFCTYKELVEHKRTHPNTCWKCNINFKSVEEYNDHLKSHEENVCSECGRVFKNKGLCNSHKARTHKVKSELQSVNLKKTKVYSCPICHIPYTFRELPAHKKTHTNTCWKCVFDFKSIETYKNHCKEHEENVCSECGKVFENAKRCNIHKAIHAKDKWLCTICGQKLTSQSNLIVHYRNHSGKKIYECSYCQKKFLNWNVRKYHIRNHHTFEKPFACDLCTRRFANKGHLVAHMERHTNVRRFACTLCDLTFRTNSELKTHGYKHSGEKRVFCTDCNKGFFKKHNLKVHMMTHSGDKNYVCSVCHRGFSQAHVLRTHMKTHNMDPTSNT